MSEQAYPGAETSRVTFGNRVEAFFAVPLSGEGSFPAVVLGHERYGLVKHTLDLAAKFAAHGYICIAPDMFSRWDGDKEALNRGDIQHHLSDDDIKSYMSESVDFLLAHPKVDPKRLVGMGVCQSGSYPLLLNSIRPEITANVVVYGGAQVAEFQAKPPRRTEPYEDIVGRITAPVIGIWGEDDFVISIDDVLKLRNLLEQKRKSYEFTLFRDMPHGWMNDTMPGRYRPKETAVAWKLVLDFIERVHAGAFPKDRMIWKFESDAATSYDFTKKVRLA
jgi:carboxymethylenebutenolidase